ncbi:hypothetical protein TH5_01695 [Thalassospira xianhensis MCCC 1A02616]|uniref:Uncharacterized protein n=1 Tax=Thalassospira xianhensis MCCC 1A02616 TaxID=1177929 RepID=A0A367UJG0_9PROT|nr:hypothetical protein TH5_01695 [Thalassospira xianhensis MCCC 1A02616]
MLTESLFKAFPAGIEKPSMQYYRGRALPVRRYYKLSAEVGNHMEHRGYNSQMQSVRPQRHSDLLESLADEISELNLFRT